MAFDVQTIIEVAQKIYQLVDQAKANQSQFKLLRSRVKEIEQRLSALEKIKDRTHFESGLQSLYDCLQDIARFLPSFSGKHYLKKVLKGGAYREKFSEYNRQLELATQQLHMDIDIQKLFAIETLQAAWKEDKAALQVQVPVMKRELVTLYREEEKTKRPMYDAATQRKIQHQKERAITQRIQWHILQEEAESSTKIIPDALQADYFDISFSHFIEQGTFGTIFFGTYQDRDVAIKTLDRKISEADREEFVREVAMTGRLDHPNIVKIYGAYLDDNLACMVLAFAYRGSLFDVLRAYVLTEDRQQVLIHGIVDGLSYLHGQGIEHRDLKSRNVLVDAQFHPMLTDFGRARVTTTSGISSSSLSSAYAWLAPEVILRGAHSPKADIYSLGVILWEIVTGEIPLRGLTQQQIKTKLAAGSRDEAIPFSAHSVYQDLIRACWTHDVARRPLLAEIKQRITGMMSRPGSPIPTNGEARYFEGRNYYDQGSYTQAMQCFREAAANDDAGSYAQLALCYRDGKGVPADKAQMTAHYRAGAESGHARSMFNYAIAEEYGDGTGKAVNSSKALFWYHKANDAGHEKAQERITALERRMK